MSENTESCDCSIERILKTPFRTMKLEEKLFILKKGRPTPNLNLISNHSNANRNSYSRHFQPKLYEALPWLSGCRAKTKLFCWPCLLFSKEETVWSTTGYDNLQNFGKSEKRHEASSPHIIALKEMKKFTKVFGRNMKSKPTVSGVEKKEIELHNLKVKKNRFAFKHLTKVVGSLGKLGIDLNSDESSSKLYFDEILKLVSSYNTELKFFMMENSDSIWSQVQQIPKALTECLLSEIKKEISRASYVSLILDGVTDTSKKDYVCVTLRYIRDNGDIVERLVRYWDTTSSSTAAFENIQQVLSDFNCALKLVAFSFDNAVIKPSEVVFLADLKRNITKICNNAVFVHYYAHDLAYILLQSVNHFEKVRLFITELSNFGDFFLKCEKGLALLELIQPDVVFERDNPFQLAETVFKNRKEILNLLHNILLNTNDWDTCTVSSASDLLLLLRDFDFNFLLSLFSTINPQYQLVNQGFLSNITQPNVCHIKIGCFINFLSFTKGNFHKHLIEFQRTAPKFYDVSANAMVQSSFEKVKKDCEKLYTDVLENFIMTINERFMNLDKLEFFCLLDRDQFKMHHMAFPQKAVTRLIEYHPFAFNVDRLKNELIAIYSDLEFRSVYNLHGYISFQELEDVFSETLKLSRILATVPLAIQPTSASARIRDFVKESCMSKTIFMKVEKDTLEDLLEQDRFLEKVVDKLVIKETRYDFLHKSLKKQPGTVFGSGLDFQITSVTPSNMVADDSSTLISSDVDPPNSPAAGPSSQDTTSSNMMEQKVHLAMTCDIYPANVNPTDSLSAETVVKQEDSSEVSMSDQSLFEPAVLIKEELVTSEEE